MKLERQIRRVFGLKKAPRSNPEHLPPENERSLAFLGYPTLRQADFFLGLQSLERWQNERSLAFPPGCCVCLQEANRYLPACIDKGWLGLRGKERILERTPHCERHGDGDEARLIATVDFWGEAICHVSLIGLNETFLSETAELNQTGEVPPPWRAFPEYSPVSGGWRQGNGEYWMARVWSPFWNGLPEAERTLYLERWAVPSEWRAWLT